MEVEDLVIGGSGRKSGDPDQGGAKRVARRSEIRVIEGLD